MTELYLHVVSLKVKIKLDKRYIKGITYLEPVPGPAPAPRVLAPAVPELQPDLCRVLGLTVAGRLAETVALVAAVLLLSCREPEMSGVKEQLHVAALVSSVGSTAAHWRWSPAALHQAT